MSFTLEREPTCTQVACVDFCGVESCIPKYGAVRLGMRPKRRPKRVPAKRAARKKAHGGLMDVHAWQASAMDSDGDYVTADEGGSTSTPSMTRRSSLKPILRRASRLSLRRHTLRHETHHHSLKGKVRALVESLDSPPESPSAWPAEWPERERLLDENVVKGLDAHHLKYWLKNHGILVPDRAVASALGKVKFEPDGVTRSVDSLYEVAESLRSRKTFLSLTREPSVYDEFKDDKPLAEKYLTYLRKPLKEPRRPMWALWVLHFVPSDPDDDEHDGSIDCFLAEVEATLVLRPDLGQRMGLPDENGNTIIMHAASVGDVSACHALIGAFPTVRFSISYRRPDGGCALHIALARRCPKLIQLFEAYDRPELYEDGVPRA